MSAEWKPGDVVAATVGERENVRLIAGWSRHEPQLRWCEMSPRWGDGDDDECWFMPDRVTNHRRLVAIDPEDMESVERLNAAQDAEYARCGIEVENYGGGDVDVLQAALREFATPKTPKPEEPTGLGAVVEDESGDKWTRFSTEGIYPWMRDGGGNKNWADVAAVRILSPGVAVAR